MKKRKKKAIRILAVLFLGGILICAGIFGIGFVKASAIVKESGRTIFSEKENSYIYGDDGQVLAKLNTGEDRVYLEYDQIPEAVVQAFVAVEDRRFYAHPGVDVMGILRSMAVYVRSGGSTIQGGSTITQQLARTVFLSNEVTIERKVKEIFLAMALEARYLTSTMYILPTVITVLRLQPRAILADPVPSWTWQRWRFCAQFPILPPGMIPGHTWITRSCGGIRS